MQGLFKNLAPVLRYHFADNISINCNQFNYYYNQLNRFELAVVFSKQHVNILSTVLYSVKTSNHFAAVDILVVFSQDVCLNERERLKW